MLHGDGVFYLPVRPINYFLQDRRVTLGCQEDHLFRDDPRLGLIVRVFPTVGQQFRYLVQAFLQLAGNTGFLFRTTLWVTRLTGLERATDYTFGSLAIAVISLFISIFHLLQS